MPENYIALFRTPSEKEALEIIRRAEEAIDQAASVIKREGAFPEPGVTLGDRVSSGIVNDIFYPVIVHSKKFYVTDACISCGKCERVCPLQNIHLNQGKPVWGNSCTHCMACICRCPKGRGRRKNRMRQIYRMMRNIPMMTDATMLMPNRLTLHRL